MERPTTYSPVFRLLRNGNIGNWSDVTNYFKATLIGLVVADIHYSGHVFFTIDSKKLLRLKRRQIFHLGYLDLDTERIWPVFRHAAWHAADVRKLFCDKHPEEWRQIKIVSDWLLSLPASDLLQSGLTRDMWERDRIY